MAAADHHRFHEERNVRLLGNLTFPGVSGGMHVNLKDGYAFFAHQEDGGTSIVDVRDPRDPRLVGRIPAPQNTRSHKVQVLGDLLLINRERRPDGSEDLTQSPWAGGLSIYDVSDPTRPREVSFWAAAGRGVHRMTFWHEPYAYVTSGASQFDEQILIILDLSDPAHPIEVGRWWVPGMRRDERESRSWPEERRVRIHHGVPRDGLLYCGWWDHGVVILDVSDPSAPSAVGELSLTDVDPPSRSTHSVVPIPGRDVAVVTDEATTRFDSEFHARLIDVSDPSDPRLLSRLPVPDGDYADRGGRFGPHNVHEPRPGSFSSSDLVLMTYFAGGLRIVDVRDPAEPHEVGWFVPKAPAGQPSTQLNDLYVHEDGLAYVSDRNTGGLYILELSDSLL